MKTSLILLVCLFFAGAAFAQNKGGEGKAVYTANCVLCHGEDGHAQTPLGKQLGAHDLHSAEVQKKTDAALKGVITHGQKSMPAFQGQLSPAQIGQVLAYVRGMGKKK